MKAQDILFFIVLVLLVILRKPRYFVVAGLTCLTFSMPLFAMWVFFTAERLTWYAAGFFFIFILFSLLRLHKVQ